MRRPHVVTLPLVVCFTLVLGFSPSMATNDGLDTPADRAKSAAPREAKQVGMIAYAVGNIFTIHTDGSHRRKLTTTGAWGPVWSPDGTTIAFERDDGIALMDATGDTQRWLVKGSSPAWSPDGQRLSYMCRSGSDDTYLWGFSDLCVLDLRDGTETVLVEHIEDWPGVDDSTWSSDGAWIAFTRISADGDDYTRQRQLFRVRSDGTDITAIAGTHPLAREPAWSPDGATIMYTSAYDGRGGEYSGDLMSIRPDGTDKTQVTRLIGTDSYASWSSDGRRVAMFSYGGLLPYKQGIWTANPDGTEREFVVWRGHSPSWRPGYTAAPPPVAKPEPARGPLLAYVAASDAGFDLFTVRPDGRRVRQLTTGGRVVDPTWSPDHSRIAYSDGNPAEVYGRALRVMDVRSRKTQRVGRAIDPYLGGITWSPDGHRLAWGTYRSLVIFDLRTGERSRVPVTDGDGSSPRDASWSPDGSQIAFSLEYDSGTIDIMVVPAAGGEVRAVTRLRGLERHLDWSPDGRRILFSHQPSGWRDRDVDVKSVRLDGTGLRNVRATPELDLAPAWSPDGQRVVMYSDGPRPFGNAPQPGLWTVGARGGAPQLVVRDRSITYVDW